MKWTSFQGGFTIEVFLVQNKLEKNGVFMRYIVH